MTIPLLHHGTRMRPALFVIIALVLLVVHPAIAVAPADVTQPAEPIRYPAATLADPGGRVLLYFEVRNVGTTTWTPGSVVLRNVQNPLGAAAQLGLSRNVLPNEAVYWDFEVSAPRAPGIHESTWQIMSGGTALGPRMTCYIIVVPPEAKALRAQIQKLIDDFNAQHGQDVKQLIRQISDLFAKEGKGLIQRLLGERCGLLPGLLAMLAAALTMRRRNLP